jgi:hypothetical protein
MKKEDCLNWYDAETYCGGLILAAKVWHLPSEEELGSLIDENSALPEIFLMDYGPFWTTSQSTCPGGYKLALSQNYSGYMCHKMNTEKLYVICVNTE